MTPLGPYRSAFCETSFFLIRDARGIFRVAAEGQQPESGVAFEAMHHGVLWLRDNGFVLVPPQPQNKAQETP